MLVYSFFIKLADDVPPEDAIELYFKKVSDYFTIATNYSCKVDFDKQKINIKDGLIFNIDLEKAYG